MKCPKCKNEITNDSVFCEYCGAQIKQDVNKNSSKFWKWGAIVSFVLLIISLVCSLGGSNDNTNTNALRNEISIKNGKISTLNSQIEEYKKEISTLNSRINDYQTERDQLYVEIDKLKRKNNSNSYSSSDNTQQINSLKQQINSLNKIIDEKDKIIKSRERTIEDLQKENGVLKGLI